MSVTSVTHEISMAMVFASLRLKNRFGTLNHFKEKKNSVKSMDTMR